MHFGACSSGCTLPGVPASWCMLLGLRTAHARCSGVHAPRYALPGLRSARARLRGSLRRGARPLQRMPPVHHAAWAARARLPVGRALPPRSSATWERGKRGRRRGRLRGSFLNHRGLLTKRCPPPPIIKNHPSRGKSRKHLSRGKPAKIWRAGTWLRGSCRTWVVCICPGSPSRWGGEGCGGCGEGPPPILAGHP